MWEKRILIFAVGFILIIPAFLSAQTAAELEAVLESPAVSFAQAAQFVIASAGSASEGSEEAAAEREAGFRQAMDRRWLREGTSPDGSITLGRLSFLVMKAFNLKGGMMYAIAPGPRYAYRSMVSRSYIQGASDPAMTVSGERFLQILGRVLSDTGEDQ